MKTLNNNNSKTPYEIKPSSRDKENIFEKDEWLEAALIIVPLVLLLDDPVQTGPVDNPIFVITTVSCHGN